MKGLYLLRVYFINENGGEDCADVGIVRGKTGAKKYAKEHFMDNKELKLIPLDVKPNEYLRLNR